MVGCKYFIRKISVFAIGLCFVAFGIAVMTRAGLGCSPIAAIPYSLFNLMPGASYGQWIIIFNLSLVTLEWLILKRGIRPVAIAAQVGLTLLLGCYVDIFMNLAVDMAPHEYSARLLVVGGCSLSISIGTAICVIAHLADMPVDGFASAIATSRGQDYGRVHLCADAAMVLIALSICIQAFHAPVAVREGTVIAAIITGFLIKFFIRFWDAHLVRHKYRI